MSQSAGGDRDGGHQFLPRQRPPGAEVGGHGEQPRLSLRRQAEWVCVEPAGLGWALVWAYCLDFTTGGCTVFSNSGCDAHPKPQSTLNIQQYKYIVGP